MRVRVKGAAVQIADWGDPFRTDRPSLVWLHGAGMDHTVWTLQARAKPFRALNSLAVDLPGHGRSGGRARGTIGGAANWLLAMLDALGIEGAALVGHSMGALIALEAAAAAPARIERLALLGAAAAMPVHPELLKAAAARLATAAAMIAEWGIGGAAKLTGGGTPGVSLTSSARALLETSRPGVLATDLAACNAYGDGEARAAAVDCPTLVIAGAQDRMTPARQGQRLAGLIAGARCVVIPGAGHMMMLERPRPVLDALAAFLVEEAHHHRDAARHQEALPRASGGHLGG
jgi:pimeloyl-ACP methyl ester carboxylesterase